MLQTIEAEILPNGHIMLLEPLNLKHKVKAYVTILSDVVGTSESDAPNCGKELLQLLSSDDFANAPKSNSHQLDQITLANRNTWND